MIATIDPQTSGQRSRSRTYWRWPMIIVGILSAHVGLMGLATAITLRHPGESAVIPNYYDKAESWDAYKRQLEAAEKLGWKTTVVPGGVGEEGHRQLRVVLTDTQDLPITNPSLSIRCFHLSHGDEAVTLKPLKVGSCAFLLTLPSKRTGFWQLELTASAGNASFTKTLTQYVD